MIQMRMCNKYVVDQHQLRERHVADPGSGIDQDVVVDEQRGGAQMPPADSTAAPEYSQLHRSRLFGLERRHAVPVGTGRIDAALPDAF